MRRHPHLRRRTNRVHRHHLRRTHRLRRHPNLQVLIHPSQGIPLPEGIPPSSRDCPAGLPQGRCLG